MRYRFPMPLRFIIPLLLALALTAWALVSLMEGLTVRWFIRGLDLRSHSRMPLRRVV